MKFTVLISFTDNIKINFYTTKGCWSQVGLRLQEEARSSGDPSFDLIWRPRLIFLDFPVDVRRWIHIFKFQTELRWPHLTFEWWHKNYFLRALILSCWKQKIRICTFSNWTDMNFPLSKKFWLAKFFLCRWHFQFWEKINVSGG